MLRDAFRQISFSTESFHDFIYIFNFRGIFNSHQFLDIILVFQQIHRCSLQSQFLFTSEVQFWSNPKKLTSHESHRFLNLIIELSASQFGTRKNLKKKIHRKYCISTDKNICDCITSHSCTNQAPFSSCEYPISKCNSKNSQSGQKPTTTTRNFFM